MQCSSSAPSGLHGYTWGLNSTNSLVIFNMYLLSKEKKNQVAHEQTWTYSIRKWINLNMYSNLMMSLNSTRVYNKFKINWMY